MNVEEGGCNLFSGAVPSVTGGKIDHSGQPVLTSCISIWFKTSDSVK